MAVHFYVALRCACLAAGMHDAGMKSLRLCYCKKEASPDAAVQDVVEALQGRRADLAAPRLHAAPLQREAECVAAQVAREPQVLLVPACLPEGLSQWAATLECSSLQPWCRASRRSSS